MGIGHYGTMGTPKSLKFGWVDPQDLLLLPLYEKGYEQSDQDRKKYTWVRY